jgi:hypothetical protein
MPSLLDLFSVLAELKVPFCIPLSLPEPVYFPNPLDDKVRKSMEYSRVARRTD